jgi:hypothetical protein
MACDAEQLTIKNLPGKPNILLDRTYGVAGCGKRASYKYVRDGVGWVLEMVTTDASPSSGDEMVP